MSAPASSSPAAIRPATPADRPAVLDLLAGAGLPAMGVSRTLDDFLVAERDGRIVGAAGLERYGPDALLRSAVVLPSLQGTGLGGALVAGMLATAQARGVRAVYLLTTTAERYFPRFGFAPVDRAEVPEPVRQSDEFREACPASATVMRRTITGS